MTLKAGLIYYTPQYPKLCEAVARVCYQSYSKVNDTSESFIRSIMAKGHLSIASVGNIVFGVGGIKGLDQSAALFADLNTFREINPFVKVTIPDAKRNPNTKIGFIISMNVLAFLDIYNNVHKYDLASSIWELLERLFMGQDELAWFLNRDVVLPPKENPYISKGTPELYKPIILEEDYTILKEIGLTDYELEIHSSVTVNYLSDRAAGLQSWRHFAGGCELSQRYVSRQNAQYREFVDLDELIAYKVESGFPASAGEELKALLKDHEGDALARYEAILDKCKELNIHAGRAKEYARSVLPSHIVTQIIQNRPLRYWHHFFELRDSKHAQREIQEDTIAIKKAFKDANIYVPTI